VQQRQEVHLRFAASCALRDVCSPHCWCTIASQCKQWPYASGCTCSFGVAPMKVRDTCAKNEMGRCLLLLQLCILQCEKPRQPLLLLLAANAFVVASTAACHYHCYCCCYYYYYYSCSCCYGHYCWLSLQVLLLPLLLLLLLLPLLLLLVLLPVRLRRRKITVETWHKQKTSVSFACAQSCRLQCTSQYALIATVHTSIIA
jgi:hypothetical protein